MKVAVISANLGDYDPPAAWPAFDLLADVSVDVHRLTDENFPPRPLAMTSRLQCGIPKWFGSDYAPGAEVLIWIDASCAPTPIAVRWFLERLGDADIALFQHPERATVRAEAEFMATRMRRPGETYLTSRYAGEWLGELFARLVQEQKAELPLYASTAFAYRPTPRILAAFAECFLLKARYLLHDQLALPYVLDKHGCRVSVIGDNYLRCEALTFTRKKKATAA